jgi:hypothetical protein
MMKHGKHLYLMIGFAVLAAVLFFTGIAGSGWVLLLLVGGCAVMMFFMMRGMGGGQPGRDGRREPADEPSPPRHDRHG